MSTDTAPAPATDPEPTAVAPRFYGFSVLLSGFARMWRATFPALVIIAVNAGLQAALVLPDPVATTGDWLFYLQAAASLLVLLYTGAVLSSAALESVSQGRVRFAHAFGRAARRFWAFAAWSVLLIVVLIGVSLLPDIGSFPLGLWLVWGLLIFLPIAAVDGRRATLAENFRAIGAHPIRWFFTWLIMSILFIIGWLLSAVNTFFVSGWIAAAVAGFVGGIAVWWWLTAWACLYCSRSGVDPQPFGTEDDSDVAPLAGTAGSAESLVESPTGAAETEESSESERSQLGAESTIAADSDTKDSD
jgi:hypothetical protein